jgi:ribokinase
VVGDVCTDVVALLGGVPAPGSDRPAAIATRGGGAGANVAAHLAALGTPVVLAGCTVSVDPASTGPLTGYGIDRWLADTAAATVLLPNADEARLLTGCEDVTDAAQALARRHPVVVVSLGAEGALWADTDGIVHRPAHPAVVVDTTGAGDAFTAGVLSVWTAAPRRPDPVEALEAGLRRAATVVAQTGAR